MPDDNEHLFRRLERNRFAAGNDPNDVLQSGHMPAMGSVAPAGFVSDLMQDGTGKVVNDGSGILVKDASDAERVRLGKLATNSYGLRVTNPAGTVIIDGTSDMFRIVAAGTLELPSTAGADEVADHVDLVTGLDYPPASLWYYNLAGATGGAQLLPWVDWRPLTSADVLFSYEGRALDISATVTRARGRLNTSAAHFAPIYRYYILEQEAI